MDDGGIIAGAIIAIIAGMVVPFVTTQFSLWSESRRDLFRARRKALDEYVEEQSAVGIRGGKVWREQQEKDAAVRSWQPDLLDEALQTAKLRRLRSLMTTSDRSVSKMVELTTGVTRDSKPRPPVNTLAVLATWAAGRNWRAAFAARRVIRQIERYTPPRDQE
ncbi:hypothetical protein AB1K56_08040 [Microbacterium sp. BWR-S6Y]|uniref:hypothetical protein n=1 Tax=Microbacterium sp. BWR-S6Y TaxID=3232073 RepID=UPI003528C5A5